MRRRWRRTATWSWSCHTSSDELGFELIDERKGNDHGRHCIIGSRIKEKNHLLKILDEYATSEAKWLSTELIAAKNDIRALEKKVADLEKRQKK
jgi:hypothetical protein